jgi:hypothetical protein
MRTLVVQGIERAVEVHKHDTRLSNRNEAYRSRGHVPDPGCLYEHVSSCGLLGAKGSAERSSKRTELDGLARRCAWTWSPTVGIPSSQHAINQVWSRLSRRVIVFVLTI